MGREVLALNLPGAEADELNRALGVVGVDLRVVHELPGVAFDHLWVVSVLTDPEAFPALHDELYRRSGEDATGRGDARVERARAEGLVRAWCTKLAAPAIVSTTDEELAFFEAECARRSSPLAVPDVARLSPIVGDAIRHCAVAARA